MTDGHLSLPLLARGWEGTGFSTAEVAEHEASIAEPDSCMFLYRAPWEMNTWIGLLPSVGFLQQIGYL